MPAGRPKTGESVHVTFRAKGALGERITARRDYPDLTNDPLASAAAARTADGKPAVGAVASRDLYVFYRLHQAELAAAAEELTRDQVLLIIEALWGLFLAEPWLTAAPELLAGEIENTYGDDEDGPDEEHRQLAARVRNWPMLRALAVVEACIAVRDHGVGGEEPRTGPNLDAALAAAGLISTRKKHR